MNKEQRKEFNNLFSFPTVDGDDVGKLSNMSMNLLKPLIPYLGVDAAVHVCGTLNVIIAMEHAKLVEARKTNEKLEALLIEMQLLNQKERA